MQLPVGFLALLRRQWKFLCRMRTNGTHLGTVRHELARAASHATLFITRFVLINLHVCTRQIFWGRKPKFGDAVHQGFQNICSTDGICNVKIGWIKCRCPSLRVRRKYRNAFRLRRHVAIRGVLCFSHHIRERFRSQRTRKASEEFVYHRREGGGERLQERYGRIELRIRKYVTAMGREFE